MYIALNVMNMGMLYWTVHIKQHPQVCLHTITDQTPIPSTALDQLLATITRTDTDTVNQDHSPIPTDIAVTVTMIHTEDVPYHIIETIDIAS